MADLLSWSIIEYPEQDPASLFLFFGLLSGMGLMKVSVLSLLILVVRKLFSFLSAMSTLWKGDAPARLD